MLRTDDPTEDLGAAWGIKQLVRRLLKTGSLADAHTEKMGLGVYVLAANMAETGRLSDTICTWWPAIEVLIVTGVSNARTEAANTTIKNTKRTGCGFRNGPNHRTRIPLTSAAKTAA